MKWLTSNLHKCTRAAFCYYFASDLHNVLFIKWRKISFNKKIVSVWLQKLTLNDLRVDDHKDSFKKKTFAQTIIIKIKCIHIFCVIRWRKKNNTKCNLRVTNKLISIKITVNMNECVFLLFFIVASKVNFYFAFLGYKDATQKAYYLV